MTATQELLQSVLVPVTKEWRMTVERSDIDGKETITGLVAKGDAFGDWRNPDVATKTPSSAEIADRVSDKLGFKVVYSMSTQDVDDTIKFKFLRAGEPTPTPPSSDAPGVAAPSEAGATSPAPIEPGGEPAAKAKTETNGHHKPAAKPKQQPTEDALALGKIQSKREEVYEASCRMDLHKDKYAEAKAQKKVLVDELDDLIRLSKEEKNLPLLAAANAKPAANGKPGGAATPAPADDKAWRDVPIAILKEHGLTDAILKLLTDGETKNGERIAFTTIGQCSDWQAKVGQSGFAAPLTLIKGLGGAKLTKVDEAFVSFWASRGQTEKAAASAVNAELPAKTRKRGEVKPAELRGGLDGKGAPKASTAAELKRVAARVEKTGGTAEDHPGEPGRGKASSKRKEKLVHAGSSKVKKGGRR